ncbi:MAG: cupin domain-containing protein [bacterium]|nr:cupin domain-containing protein [bacterium]
MNASVVYEKDIPLTDLGGGVKRRVLAYNENMMIVEVHFEKDGVGAPHTHPHTQCTYVQSGRFRFTIDGQDAEVAAGDTIAFPPDILHGTLCLEAGVLLDIFTPMRKDFI